MIVEGIVTTADSRGVVNIAPMGPRVGDAVAAGSPLAPEQTLILRPFKTSRTYRNLLEVAEGVFHVTDDVLLIARATISTVDAPTVPAKQVRGFRLADCCQYHEFRVVERDDRADRAQIVTQICHSGQVRDWIGFNRGQHAAIEAAILASRVGILPIDEIAGELARLRLLVEKTGGPREQQAFELLWDHVQTRRQ